MFGNFIFFIVALLIYTTYQPAAQPQLPFSEALLFFAGLSLLFAAVTWILFKKLEDRLDESDPGRIEPAFQSLLTRQSILAIGLFAVHIYGLELGGYLHQIALFKMAPTLGALLFLLVFIAYLCIVWASAYNVHERLYRTRISRIRYIVSNISFSIPVLLPWLCLSAVADIINVLPFETPRAFLNTTEGQIVYFLFFLIIISIIGPALIQKFWGCTPLPADDARSRIEQICRRAGVAYQEIMTWPLFGGKMITAGVMGLIARFRYILVTPALLRYLTPTEIEAVMAHEIGHVKQKHLVFYLIFFAGYLVIAFASLDLTLYGILYAQVMAGNTELTAASGGTFFSIVFSVAMISVFLIYFRFVFGYFMRNFERQADIFVYTLMDSAEPLITTFKKIAASSGQAMDKPNWHHFSILERINYLRKCEDDSSWITAHHRKVRFSIAVYLIALFMLGWAGYNLHFGSAGQMVSSGIMERLIQQQVKENPRNADLHVLLGDLNYSREDLDAAVSAYETAIALDPENIQALNNLAWLIATSDANSPHYRPEAALYLAQKAARYTSEPHVLDTLAESYFINGMHQKAVETEEKALENAVENRAYYRKQLKKYRLAAGGKAE